GERALVQQARHALAHRQLALLLGLLLVALRAAGEAALDRLLEVTHGARSLWTGDRPPDRERIAQLGVERPVLGVRLGAHAVEDLAEEAPRRGRQHDVEDLLVGESEGPQAVDVGL